MRRLSVKKTRKKKVKRWLAYLFGREHFNKMLYHVFKIQLGFNFSVSTAIYIEVPPAGIEPARAVPETAALSTELRGQIKNMFSKKRKIKYNYLSRSTLRLFSKTFYEDFHRANRKKIFFPLLR